jgi:hypothetical protein
LKDISEEVAAMPPHCDSLDGPVVTAARRALDAGDVDVVLPYVHAQGEDEVREAFEQVLPLRMKGAEVAALADRWFFETVVRVHRAGEHAPYTGLKPAGLDVGPIIPLAEKAVETDDVEEAYQLLAADLHTQLSRRLRKVSQLATGRERSVAANRDYVQAMLDFEVYSNHIYQAIHAGPHSGHEHAE